MKPSINSSDSDAADSDVTLERSPNKKIIRKPVQVIVDESSTSSSDFTLAQFIKKKAEVTSNKPELKSPIHANPKKQNISKNKIKLETKEKKAVPSKTLKNDSESSPASELKKMTKISALKSEKEIKHAVNSHNETPRTNKKSVRKQHPTTPESYSNISAESKASFNKEIRDEEHTNKEVTKKKATKKILQESFESEDSSRKTLIPSPSKAGQPMNDSSNSDSEVLNEESQKVVLKRKRSNKPSNGESPQSKLKRIGTPETNSTTSASSDDAPLEKFVAIKVPPTQVKKRELTKGKKLSESDITERLEGSSENSDSESSEEEEQQSSRADSSSDSETDKEKKHDSSNDSETAKEEKRGRNKALNRVQKKKNELEQLPSGKKNSKAKQIIRKPNEERSSEKKAVKASNSESDRESLNESKGDKITKTVAVTKKPTDDPRITRLQRYLKLAGIRVQNYKTLWEGCKSNKSRAEKLLQLLQERGLKGKPSVAECRKIKKKYEREKEIAELSTSNIINPSGRSRRGTASVYACRRSPSPPKHKTSYKSTPDFKKAFSRLKNIVDSDDSD